MSDPSVKRNELWLYGVLLVLPTLVLAGVHWNQFLAEHEALMADVPRKAQGGARRLRDSIIREVQTLFEEEGNRPFYQYDESYYPAGTIGADLALVPSPLFSGPPREGVLAWFAYDFRQHLNAKVELFAAGRQHADDWPEFEAALRVETSDLVELEFNDLWPVRIGRINEMKRSEIPLALAAINRRTTDDLRCITAELPGLAEYEQQTLELYTSKFHLRFYLRNNEVPWILAVRRVLIRHAAHRMPECFSALNTGVTLVQGFFVDPDWLFHDLPLAASQSTLGDDLRFAPFVVPQDMDEAQIYETFNLIDELEMEVYESEDIDYGNLHVLATRAVVESRFRKQRLRLIGVTGMLFFSLATGLFLLLRSVTREYEQAARTENFVSAVTHELRTPIAAIRLYGEMLRDGWTTRQEKRNEYYERIVHEAHRLEKTVDRVLEKGRITATDLEPVVADLSCTVREVLPELCPDGPADDLQFELTDDLPDVWLNFEGVRSILLNLVENARKYAQESGTPGSGDKREPVLVRTRLHRRRVVLEVADRGPGIPASERRKVFLAFYRIGNEATRTSQGTGLGLHLVKLQAESMRARAQILDRDGGGTLIRVSFETAERDAS